MNVFASVVLVLYTQTLAFIADTAAETADAGVGALRDPSPVIHSVLALVLLLVAAVLSVYKPRGMTRRGQRNQHEERQGKQQRGRERAQAALLVP